MPRRFGLEFAGNHQVNLVSQPVPGKRARFSLLGALVARLKIGEYVEVEHDPDKPKRFRRGEQRRVPVISPPDRQRVPSAAAPGIFALLCRIPGAATCVRGVIVTALERYPEPVTVPFADRVNKTTGQTLPRASATYA